MLGLIIADLVRETYPMLRVGPATVSILFSPFESVSGFNCFLYLQKIRSLVVGNATLADMSVSWHPHRASLTGVSPDL